MRLSGTENLLFLLCLCCYAFGSLLSARTLIHWFQLESYQFPGYFRTIRRKGIKGWAPGLLFLLFTAIPVLILRFIIPDVFPRPLVPVIFAAVSAAAGFAVRSLGLRQQEKKKMVFTPRLKRLYFVLMIVFSALLLLVFFLVKPLCDSSPYYVFLFFSLVPLLLPLWTALGGLIAWPVEKLISEMYFRDAQRILKERKDLIRIGITGSWGKTSVKFILGTMLSEKYPTLVTPASYNTPMGVTKVIRTGLEPGYRVFVAEMGARHVGDIKEMCRLVHPEIGILTSVGPQHLDTFHTLERVKRTKNELMEAIPEDGYCFFADDDGIVRELWQENRKNKILAGMDPSTDDVWAEELRTGENGSTFLLCTGKEKIPCETLLLGELNIRNIVLCAAVCLKLGLTGKEISRGIKKLKPVEHRLELKKNPGGFNILDDAFNSNIMGAKQAFRVLKDFPGKRIVVTPGMVELGGQEENLNKEFGQAMASCCDEAVLVGRKRSEAIYSGLREENFEEDRIHVVRSLQEAAELLKTLAVPGDTILFENDLPDNYSEG